MLCKMTGILSISTAVFLLFPPIISNSWWKISIIFSESKWFRLQSIQFGRQRCYSLRSSTLDGKESRESLTFNAEIDVKRQIHEFTRALTLTQETGPGFEHRWSIAISVQIWSIILAYPVRICNRKCFVNQVYRDLFII